MAEKEYIEREAALSVLDEAVKTWRPDIGISKAEYLRIRYKDLPSADVRPVRRGKWINDRNGKYSASGDNFYCSICKDPSLRAFGKPAKTNYCPNCGADMRIFSTNCKNTVTTGEDREIFNLRAWLKNGKG